MTGVTQYYIYGKPEEEHLRAEWEAATSVVKLVSHEIRGTAVRAGLRDRLVALINKETWLEIAKHIEGG